jgi:hypothetical protein
MCKFFTRLLYLSFPGPSSYINTLVHPGCMVCYGVQATALSVCLVVGFWVLLFQKIINHSCLPNPTQPILSFLLSST